MAMCVALPILRVPPVRARTHIAVMGMERIVPTFDELDVILTMLARSACSCAHAAASGCVR